MGFQSISDVSLPFQLLNTHFYGLTEILNIIFTDTSIHKTTAVNVLEQRQDFWVLFYRRRLAQLRQVS